MYGRNKILSSVVVAVLTLFIFACGKKNENAPEPKVLSAGGVFVRTVNIESYAEARMNNLLYNESANCLKLYQLGSSYYLEFLKGSCAAGEATITVEVATNGLVSRGTKSIGFYNFGTGELLQFCSGTTYTSACDPVITSGYLSDIILH